MAAHSFSCSRQFNFYANIALLCTKAVNQVLLESLNWLIRFNNITRYFFPPFLFPTFLFPAYLFPISFLSLILKTYQEYFTVFFLLSKKITMWLHFCFMLTNLIDAVASSDSFGMRGFRLFSKSIIIYEWKFKKCTFLVRWSESEK